MHMQAQENPEQPEAPKHVILFSYNPQLKAMVRYDALVIGTRDFEENDRPVLNLVHFRHDDIASHHCLQGVDWADTLERTLDVPHLSDQEQQSFYYLCEGEESPAPAQPADEPIPAEEPAEPASGPQLVSEPAPSTE